MLSFVKVLAKARHWEIGCAAGWFTGACQPGHAAIAHCAIGHLAMAAVGRHAGVHRCWWCKVHLQMLGIANLGIARLGSDVKFTQRVH